MILNKSFTIKDLQTLNPDIKFVTIRAAVLRGLSNGKYTKLPRNVQTGKKGKPANIFINTKVYKANLANLAKSKAVATVTAEVVTATQQANLKRLIEKGEAFQKAAASGRDDVSIEGVNSPFFDFLLRVGGAKAGASGVLGQATGSELVAASAGSKYFRKIFDATPQAKLQELYKEILDNPKLLDDVLFQAGSRAEQRRKFQSINAALVQAGIMAPIDFSKDEEERRPMEITVNPRRQ